MARVWLDANRDLEERLKQDWAKAWCPRCRVERIMSQRDPAFQARMEQIRDDFRAVLAAAGIERRQAASERAGTQRWYRTVRAAQQQLRTARSQAGHQWVAAHSLRGLRRTVLECVLADKPVVTPPAIWRWPVRRAVAGTAAAGPRDAGEGAATAGLDHDPWSRPSSQPAPFLSPPAPGVGAEPAGAAGADTDNPDVRAAARPGHRAPTGVASRRAAREAGE